MSWSSNSCCFTPKRHKKRSQTISGLKSKFILWGHVPHVPHPSSARFMRSVTCTLDPPFQNPRSATEHMVISRKRSPYQPIIPLTVDNLLIEQVQSYRYLGVWLTSTLTWSVQVESVCQRARRQISMIYRKFYGHSNTSTLLQLYLAYVRPHLEYAVPVWDPYQHGHT